MNNFFQPQAPSVPTLKNFENGQVYSANDIFRNLFRDDIQTTILFGSGEEWEIENDLKSSINQMLFNRYYAIGSSDDEPNEDLLNKFKAERSEVVHFLLYNREESPLLSFNKSYRQMLKKVDFTSSDGVTIQRKALNIEFVEELFNTKLSDEVVQYAEQFYLSGESGDWYMNHFEKGTARSSCFEETQLKTIVRFIRIVLNVQQRATESATTAFSEGLDIDDVVSMLSENYGVESLINKALEDCDMMKKAAVCFQLYGNWVADFRSHNRHQEASGEVFEFSDLQVARQYAKARNESKKADAERLLNLSKIAELKAEMAERWDMVDDLDLKADEATANLIKAEKLARPLRG